MKTFLHYLAESTKEYEYRIRTIVPVDKAAIDRITNVLEKYNIVTISKPKKTIMHDSPLDFPNVEMGEVYIIDVKTTVPCSSEILLQELRGALNISWSEIVVRSKNDPVEIETDILNSKNHGVKDTDEDPLLSTSPEYSEYDIHDDEPVGYGNEYNKKFLSYLAKISAERDEIEPCVQPENQPKDSYSLFSKLESSEDFNKDYDTPKPVPRNKAKKNAPLPAMVSNAGNYLSKKSR